MLFTLEIPQQKNRDYAQIQQQAYHFKGKKQTKMLINYIINNEIILNATGKHSMAC